MQSAIVSFLIRASFGALAQLGERLLCKQEVIGSIPIRSMALRFAVPRHGVVFVIVPALAVLTTFTPLMR
jgi:hypothetical protein